MISAAQQLALWADQLRDHSANGLRYSQSSYDRARYQSIQEIALAMLGLATGDLPDQLELLRAPIFMRPTPLSVGDAAVIDDAGRILLIQRADNGLWAMPGGALDVGETPAEGAVREALEETGIACEALSLIGVFDSRLCGTTSRHHLYQFLFLCMPLAGVASVEPSHAHETLAVGWFGEDALPEGIDPGHVTRIPVAFRAWRGENEAFFDRPGSAMS